MSFEGDTSPGYNSFRHSLHGTCPKGRTSPCGTQADVYFNEAFKNSLEDAIITDFSCIILL